MRPWMWLLACLGVLAVVVILAAYPELFWVTQDRSDLGPPEEFGVTQDSSDLSDALRRLAAERRRSDELDAQLGDACRRIAIKKEIAAAVVARRLTLLEAAARFRAMEEQTPGFNWELFRDVIPGNSDEERYCRVVIHYGELTVLADRPAEAAEVVARLEAELRGHLERHEKVYFLEPPP